MSKIWVGKTGSVIKGHVLDVSLKPLERKLKDYDSQLYLRWAPKKLKGYGVWEIRRHDNNKTVVDFWEFDAGKSPLGNSGKTTIVQIDWHENNIVNHILDAPYLNYGILTKLKEMDTWNKGIQAHNVVEQAERNLDYITAKNKEDARKEMFERAKEFKKEFRDLREHVLTGKNKMDVALTRYWNTAPDRNAVQHKVGKG